MDNVKSGLAATVQVAVTERLDAIDGVTTTIVNELQTQARVVTPTGVRYFLIKVSEQL